MSRTYAEDQPAEHIALERFEGAIARQGGSPILVILWALMGVLGMFQAALSPDWRALALQGSLSLLVCGLSLPRLYRHIRIGGNVAVGPEGLFVEGKLLVPRAEVTAACVVEYGVRTRVTVQRSAGGDVNIKVATAEQGQRLVRALDREGSQRAVAFALAKQVKGWRMVGLVLGLLSLMSISCIGLWWQSRFGWVPVSLAQLWSPLFVAASSWLGRSTVTVGTDGILVRGFRHRQFVRFADIERTEIRDDKYQIWLHLRGGRSVQLGAKEARDTSEVLGSLRSLEKRIREMRAASDSEQAAPIGARITPPRVWIRSLRGALEKGASGFRDRALRPEQLWHALENARLQATERAAAAIALGPSLDESGKTRLRITADATADPKLRVLLGVVAGNDEDAIENALGEIEAMEEQARRIETSLP